MPNKRVIRMLTILVVDECPAVHRFVDLAVGSDNVRVVGACDGYAALDCVTRLSPDLVLAATGLPGLSGSDLAARLVSHGTPVVLMRGSLDPAPQDAGATALGILRKPLNVGDIRAVVSRISAGRTLDGDPVHEWLGGADLALGMAPKSWRRVTDSDGDLRSFAHDVAALRDGRVSMQPLRFSRRRHVES